MSAYTYSQTIEWYNQHADKCAIAWDDHFEPEQISTFVSMLPKGARVLDAGCGTGRYTCILYDTGLQVIGLDISPGMLSVAKQKHELLDFVQGDVLKLEYPTDSFEGVWAHSSLIHFESLDDVKQALSEFKRILKPGGILHLQVTCQTGPNKTQIEKSELHPEGVFYRYFTKQEVHELLGSIGYKILVLEEFDESERYVHGHQGKKWIHALAQEPEV